MAGIVLNGDTSGSLTPAVPAVAGTNTLTLPASTGNIVTQADIESLNFSATSLTSGTIPDARFPATLPAISGASLTALSATSLTSGTIPDARFPATLPAISGASLTALPAGSIIQVVNKVISTQGSQTIGTTDTQIGTGTDFDISITPQGAGSKFVVSARWFGEVDVAWNIVFNVQRDGVRINADGATALNRLGLSVATQTYIADDDNSTPEIMHLQTVDSTGSTIDTAITYTLVASASGSGRVMWTNRMFNSAYEQGISELTVMEIAQ